MLIILTNSLIRNNRENDKGKREGKTCVRHSRAPVEVDPVGDVRGRGAMQALEFVMPGTTEPNPAAQSAVIKYCLQKGVLLLSAGTYGNVVRLLPPLVMPENLLKEALEILDEAISKA